MNRFNLIAKNYEEAMTTFPDARTDYVWLLDKLRLKNNDRVLEISAGTGFLTEKILDIIKSGELYAQDVSKIALEINKKKNRTKKGIRYYLSSDPELTKLQNNYFDKAICLGGFHHIEEQSKILKSIFKKLKVGGIFCIGDFADCSAVQEYFDNVVHKHTKTGHKGLFLTRSRMINLGRISGFTSLEVVRTKVPFIFTSKKNAGRFYKMVHDLDCSVHDSLLFLQKYMGLKQKRKKVIVPMDYIYVKYKKNHE